MKKEILSLVMLFCVFIWIAVLSIFGYLTFESQPKEYVFLLMILAVCGSALLIFCSIMIEEWDGGEKQ